MQNKLTLVTKNLCGFSEEVALKLLMGAVDAEKHYWTWCEKQGIQQGYCFKGYAQDNYVPYAEGMKLQETQEHTLKQFEYVKKALLEGRLLLWCAGGVSWRIAVIHDNKINTLSLRVLKSLCAYSLNYETRAYKMSCYGASRPLEIILNFGYRLGLKFGEIRQDQQIL